MIYHNWMGAMKHIKIVVAVFVICGFLAPYASACTFAWDAPITNDDGSPLTNLASYNLYLRSPGATIGVVAGATPATTLDRACALGEYWVTALNTYGQESLPSNSVFIKQPNPPTGLLLTSGGVLSWVAPTANTDTSPLTDFSAYRVYFQAFNGPVTQLWQGTTTSTTVLIAKGSYWVTVVNVVGIESVASLSVVVKNPNKPNAFTVAP